MSYVCSLDGESGEGAVSRPSFLISILTIWTQVRTARLCDRGVGAVSRDAPKPLPCGTLRARPATRGSPAAHGGTYISTLIL
ncbi:Uncharacterised protein [Bordetella pertussis]|nr:Uncharacterised protein [Bordetella pertussis]